MPGTGRAFGILLLLVVVLCATGWVAGQTPPWKKNRSAPTVNPNLPRDPLYERASQAAVIDPKLGAVVPRDLVFVDDHGREVRLGDYFTGERPVVVTLTYFTCPQLCGLVMKGLVTALKKLDWRPGYEFTVLNVSIDPRDTASASADRKANHIRIYERGDDTVRGAWHYLTGQEPSIRALADAVGYGFAWIPEKEEFSHGAGLFVFTPDGVLSDVIPGIEYTDQVGPHLFKAADGDIGSITERLYFMLCWRWDPETGKYSNIAMTLMRFGALVMVLSMAGLIYFLNRQGPKRTAGREDLPHEEPSPEIHAGIQP